MDQLRYRIAATQRVQEVNLTLAQAKTTGAIVSGGNAGGAVGGVQDDQQAVLDWLSASLQNILAEEKTAREAAIAAGIPSDSLGGRNTISSLDDLPTLGLDPVAAQTYRDAAAYGAPGSMILKMGVDYQVTQIDTACIEKAIERDLIRR